MFVCMDCFEYWKPDFKLADGSPCDELRCRLCTGKECPDCGGHNIDAVVSMAQVRRLKNLKNRED
jgi:hypothetical protein